MLNSVPALTAPYMTTNSLPGVVLPMGTPVAEFISTLKVLAIAILISLCYARLEAFPGTYRGCVHIGQLWIFFYPTSCRESVIKLTMSLYINHGRGHQAKIWLPGDFNQPNQADSKEELLSFCLKPDPFPCYAAECDNRGDVRPQAPKRRHPRWCWMRTRRCGRCNILHSRHGLELIELVTLWETQDRKCYHCSGMLADPRIVGRKTHIDHDHNICPQRNHSCKKCRRGLACNPCNTNELSVRKADLWIPSEEENFRRWLEFIGTSNRSKLRNALKHFPEPAPEEQ